jgi:hypothetical protein
MMKAPIRYGLSMRLKLAPLPRIATNSLRCAIFEVKKIIEMNVKRGLNRFPYTGMNIK